MYYLISGLLHLLSWLPMPVLYLLGSGLRVIIFDVLGYRRALVMDNLRRSFPARPEEELRAIARQFEVHFMDTWMEVVKLISIRRAGLDKMLQGDLSVFKSLAADGKSCQLMSGHFMNWELYPLFIPLHQPLLLLGVYMPLSNAAMNKIFLRLRSRFGTAMVPANEVKNGLQAYQSIPHILGLGANQSPPKPAQAFWMYFLQQPTAFPTGPARNACRTNVPVVFTWLEKTARGRYRMHAEMLTEHPQQLGEQALTRLYALKLEEVIQRHPDNYLWSHRRWKHAWKAEYAGNWVGPELPPS